MGRNIGYTYDANGNITTVTVDGVLQDTYTYDGLNQLIRHDDAVAHKSYEFIYDDGGNILYKKEYAYTTGTLGAPTATIPYTYSSSWKDQVASYNGQAIAYDEIGNTVSYDGYTYDWEKGRQLSSITGNGISASYEYNSSGLRTKKVVGDKTIEYYYSGNLLVAQFDGETLVRFIYSPSGEVIGFTCGMVFSDGEIVDGDYCYYVKNAQGDITGFYSMFLSIYREYTYDAWGNVTGVYDEKGRPVTNPNDSAFLNPLRYRSYYYDDETGLYYLNSRYYNPEWGRFISADAFADTGQGVIATNMYAYCLNNPVNLVDPTGLLSDYIKDIVTRPRKPININGNAFLNTANGFLNSNSQPANTTQSHASSTTQSSILSNPKFEFVCGVVSDFNKNSLIAIADYKLGNIGSTSIGVVSFLSFVNDLGNDYYEYHKDPEKMIDAMLITFTGTIVSFAGGMMISMIPGVGPFLSVVGGVIWDTTVGQTQEYLKDQL